MELRERRAQQTLKEKLKTHYHNRDFKPDPKNVNKLGMNFFWGMTMTLFVESQLILIPHIYSESTTNIVLMILLVWFTFIESVINWMGTYFGMVNHVSGELKAKHFPNANDTPEGWIYCITCQIDAPPRSFHCQQCNVCVLKRDHHCYFSNSCVGFHNQRFFVLFCLYMIWGNGFALFLQLTYLNEFIPINSWEIFTYFPVVTILQFLMGKISFLNFFLICHVAFCFMCFCGAIFFFAFQVMIIGNGMTSYEAWKVGPVYGSSTGKLDNFRSVFGSLRYLPLMLLMPFSIDQRGDGTSWEVRQRPKGH